MKKLIFLIHRIFSFSAVMRLGKKKERDGGNERGQKVEGITRLICLSRGQTPIKGKTKMRV